MAFEGLKCELQTDKQLHWGDIVVIAVYFVIVIIVGIASSFKNPGGIKGHFLAGKSMHWILVGASLFASNIGSGHFIGLAGTGAASGIGIAAFELNAVWILLLLGWVFVPVYIACGIYTLPEYIHKRFGGQRIRVYLSVLGLILNVFTKVAADLYAGAFFIRLALDLNEPWQMYITVIVLLVIAALFTISGGLTAVIWTDFAQTIIMIIGALVLMVQAFVCVGGYENIIRYYFKAEPNTTITARKLHLNYTYATCGTPPSNAMHLVRDASDSNLPWPGIFFGLTISATWYWCTDQVIVQRSLAAKNLSYVKLGCVLAGYLKFLPLFIMVFPGMIARILFADEIACDNPVSCKAVCGSSTGCTNAAYPLLVLRLMPRGARGMMLAVMLSSLMSSLTSVFNSSATMFTIDIWKRIRNQATEVEQVIVGRIFVVLMVGIAVAWIPIVENFGELFHYIQSVTSYLAPPICAIYVLAVFMKRINEKGAFWSLMIGFVVGLIRMIWQFSYGNPACGEYNGTPDIIAKVHYLHFGIILFAITAVACIVISLVTDAPDDDQLAGTTFWTRHDVDWGTFGQSQASSKELVSHGSSRTSLYFDNIGFSANPSGGSIITKSGSENGLDADSKSSVPSSQVASAQVSTNDVRPEVKLEEVEEDHSTFYKLLFKVCGGKPKADNLTDEERFHQEKQRCSLEETKKSRIITSINAILILAISIFVWGFYG
ncbi:unnamed protein product [Owenia fusiformis]|uniref:Uncharacterized protein n=1 Tax=Owenia fusiformis TaxID=6347 RepID=A0A8J1TLM9_OWEFU|nr:unnamed protein product [Owenia fusiformis]